MYLITKWFGTFLCDDDGVKKEILFPKDEQEIEKRLHSIEQQHILAEEKKLAKNTKVIVNEKRLESLGEYDDTDPFFKTLVIHPEDYGFPQELFHNIIVRKSRGKVEQQLQSEDLQIIQMVNALDDLVQTANLLSERISCWMLIPTPKEKIKPFEETLTVVQKEIIRLEQQIETDMNTIAPNTSKITGPLIGARLIALGGGMHRMEHLPTSTIQILGAEKALFRFKKEGGKPPKHGVIFQHPLINKAPRPERGRLSRMLAIHIAMAMKADVFTKRDISAYLEKEMEKRIQEIRRK